MTSTSRLDAAYKMPTSVIILSFRYLSSSQFDGLPLSALFYASVPPTSQLADLLIITTA